MKLVEAQIPKPYYFEFDLAKANTILGYRPVHDLQSILETAEATRRGEDTGIIPTGIRYGGA